MISVEPALFTNVITTVQRTARLTGGAVRGLPGGATVDGLPGVSSIGSDVTEAQKEFELGRVRNAMDRIRQIESMFSAAAGRWNSQVQTLISTAKQGKQALPLQKLNEVRAAQTKMQQLISPAEKSLRDLVSALELAVSNEGRDGDRSADPVRAEGASDQTRTEPQVDSSDSDEPVEEAKQSIAPERETPEPRWLGNFADKYEFGPRLKLQTREDGKRQIVPPLEPGRFYFLEGADPPRVIRLRSLGRGHVIAFDRIELRDRQIETAELKQLMRSGIWRLENIRRR